MPSMENKILNDLLDKYENRYFISGVAEVVRIIR